MAKSLYSLQLFSLDARLQVSHSNVVVDRLN